MQKCVTVIDTFGFFFRSFYALPPLTNDEGFPTGVLTGLMNLVTQIQKEYQSEYIVFALDSKGDSFRKAIDTNYKANREEAPQDLKRQLPVAIEWINKMGFATLEKSGFEADDVIATVVKLSKAQGYKVRIISHDKDLYQLIDDGQVVVVDAIKRKKIDQEACVDKYGVTPEQFIDYQSLLGDSADNVPGVKGIGKVTAQKLLSQHQTLDTMYANLDNVEPMRIRKLLSEHKEDALRSRKLVSLRCDVFDSVDFENFDVPTDPLMAIVDELQAYNMNAQLRVLKAKGKLENSTTNTAQKPTTQEAPKLEFEAVLLNTKQKLFDVIDAIQPNSIVALDTETTGLERHKDSLVGFSFALGSAKGYYVPIAHSYLGVGEQIAVKDAKTALKKLLSHKLVGHNLKFDLGFLYDFVGIKQQPIYTDTMILAWMLDSGTRVGLDYLSEKYFGYAMTSFSKTVKKGETFASVTLEDAAHYAAEDAWMTYKIYTHLLDLIDLRGGSTLLSVAKDVEYPFIEVLIDMESRGITVDTLFLQELHERFTKELKVLEQTIYTHAGSPFNINSPKQLGVVLFETLNLPVIKKNKTGYSTDENVLHALKDEHEIIESLLEYREVFKLFSTYVQPLLELGKADTTHTIHTSFVHTGTATGRLSSKNPNLQNIPTKTQTGRLIRNAFVAREGMVFIGIDYSQIELRLLAHFSKDSVLVDSFNQDLDIHTQTAAKLFGKEDAQKMRHVAKTVNFGLLYGMGPKKLAQTLDIPTKEAKEIIDNYFTSFPTVKEFLTSVADKSEAQGFVETILKRRRWFEYKNAAPMMKASFRREAVNAVFQGSAADLIKLSMNKIAKHIDADEDAFMLLQIHDELIFEVKKEKAQEYAQEFEQIMRTIYTLDVPLKCSVAIASRWGELK